MKQYNSFGTFIRVFSSKNICLRLPDIIVFAYYTCFLVETLGFVLALRSPLQANLKIPGKTRVNPKKGEGPWFFLRASVFYRVFSNWPGEGFGGLNKTKYFYEKTRIICKNNDIRQPQASVFGRKNTYKSAKMVILFHQFIRAFTSKVQSQSAQNHSKPV